MENLKIKGIRAAVKDFNEWQGHAVIMYDVETGDIWTDIFADGNSWNEYHKKSIISVYGKDNFWGRDDTVTMKELKEAVKTAVKEREAI